GIEYAADLSQTGRVRSTNQGTQFGSNVDGHFFIRSSADLEGNTSCKTEFSGRTSADHAISIVSKQTLTRISGIAQDVRQLFAQFVVFGLQRGLVVGAVSAVGSLGSQIFHALNDVSHFAERTFRGLQQRDRIASVTHGYCHTARLRVQTGSDLQTCSVVRSRVNAQASA